MALATINDSSAKPASPDSPALAPPPVPAAPTYAPIPMAGYAGYAPESAGRGSGAVVSPDDAVITVPDSPGRSATGGAESEVRVYGRRYPF